MSDDQLLTANEALDKLAGQSKLKSGLVKLRYFVGMTLEKVAQALAFPRAPPTTTEPMLRSGFFRELKSLQQ